VFQRFLIRSISSPQQGKCYLPVKYFCSLLFLSFIPPPTLPPSLPRLLRDPLFHLPNAHIFSLFAETNSSPFVVIALCLLLTPPPNEVTPLFVIFRLFSSIPTAPPPKTRSLLRVFYIILPFQLHPSSPSLQATPSPFTHFLSLPLKWCFSPSHFSQKLRPPPPTLLFPHVTSFPTNTP